MIDIKLFGAIIQTPEETIFIGAYDSQWEARNAIKEAIKEINSGHSNYADGEIYADDFIFSLGESVCYRFQNVRSAK